jgi:hypothetical protein
MINQSYTKNVFESLPLDLWYEILGMLNIAWRRLDIPLSPLGSSDAFLKPVSSLQASCLPMYLQESR